MWRITEKSLISDLLFQEILPAYIRSCGFLCLHSKCLVVKPNHSFLSGYIISDTGLFSVILHSQHKRVAINPPGVDAKTAIFNHTIFYHTMYVYMVR